MFTYHQNSRVLQEIGVTEHDVDVRFLTRSRNAAVSQMRNEKYAIWPLVMAESPKLLHNSAMDLWTRLWGRYHVPQNVFLVSENVHFEICQSTMPDDCGCNGKLLYRCRTTSLLLHKGIRGYITVIHVAVVLLLTTFYCCLLLCVARSHLVVCVAT